MMGILVPIKVISEDYLQTVFTKRPLVKSSALLPPLSHRDWLEMWKHCIYPSYLPCNCIYLYKGCPEEVVKLKMAAVRHLKTWWNFNCPIEDAIFTFLTTLQIFLQEKSLCFSLLTDNISNLQYLIYLFYLFIIY